MEDLNGGEDEEGVRVNGRDCTEAKREVGDE